MRIKDFAPKAYAAAAQLVGGEQRIAEPFTTGDGFIANFGLWADKGWAPPGPQSSGWHKDGGFFKHFLDSPEQGLLTIFVFNPMRHQGGGTFVACDSVGPVARFMAEHPEGLTPAEMKPLIQQAVRECSDFVELTGDVGDVILLHPFTLHASSPNVIGAPRFITNPPVHLAEPLKLNRPDGDYSPVERSILNGLGVERYDFEPTGERETFRK